MTNYKTFMTSLLPSVCVSLSLWSEAIGPVLVICGNPYHGDVTMFEQRSQPFGDALHF